MIQNPCLTTNKIKLLSVCFFVTTLPHFLQFPYWISILVVCSIAWRFRISTTGNAIPGLVIRILLISLSVTLIIVHYGTLLGRDPGVAFLILMLAFKMLEMKTRRDVLVFLILNYFVVVTNFLYSQNILLAVYMFLAVWLITTVLIQINRLNDNTAIGKDARLAITLLLQATPIMLTMFLLFPRIETSLWKIPDDNLSGSTGLSDKMTPGDISELIKNKKIAFRASFNKQAPGKQHMYWRGPVLSLFDGRSWHTSPPLPLKLPDYRLHGSSYNYTITLEATGKKYLPTLDLPANAPENAWLSREYTAYSNFKINSRKAYQVYSRTLDANTADSEAQTVFYTRLPHSFNPRTRAYVYSLTKQVNTEQELIYKILENFRKQNFVYTLTPPLLGRHAIDDFLFSTQRGFCEHYASAFVVMMRFAGIPARIVTGYQGGEYNPVGNYYIVRNSDAHAWVEIKLSGQAWQRIDPTAFIAPERIERGIDASLGRNRGWRQYTENPMFDKLSFYWDSFNNSWNQWVLGYGETLQTRLLALIGFDDPDWQDMVLLLFLFVALTIALIYAYYNLRVFSRSRNQAEQLYRKFSAKLQPFGLARFSWEGPLDYYRRIAQSNKKLQKKTNAIIELYIQLRYEKHSDPKLLTEFRVLVKNFKPDTLLR